MSHLILQKDGPLSDELKLVDSISGLGRLPKRLIPQKIVSMVCGYCSTGCSLNIHIKNDQAVNLTPDAAYPVNEGEACPKGWEALTPLKAADRAAFPYLRRKDGILAPVDWDAALKAFVSQFKSIQTKYGNDSVAFLSTGQIATEEMALLGALAKFGMGMTHGDSNTRQCMATAAVAYKQSFGYDAPPYTYQDFEESDCLVFVGANPCIAHPIMWQRVCRNPHKPKIIVIDPRKTETAMACTHHYALVPKSDLSLLYGLANLLIKNKWIDSSYISRHTSDFEDFKSHVKKFELSWVSEQTGISQEAITNLARMIHEGKRVSFWWTMGVNQGYEAVRTAQAIINLALMTGNMGRPGTGANSITGQCNAMGSRLFSNTTGLLGGRDFENADDRRDVADILGIDAGLIPDQKSLAYDEIIEQVVRGKIKGLWIIGTNPVHSWINANEFKKVIADNLEFLVVQDMYHTTETALMADLVLPAAGWGEKEGSLINSERRIGLIKKVCRPPGVALADFYIFKLIAQYWGCADLFRLWDSPEAVFQIMKKLSKQMPCDISGIKDYKMIDACGGIQWPLPEETKTFAQERRLFEDGRFFYKDGKAKFIFSDLRSHPEPVDSQYPFILLTGRGTSSQWHTQTRTGKSAVLRKMYPQQVYLEINREDARKMGVQQGQRVRVSTKRGEVKACASILSTIPKGQIFMPMHYPETNQLTLGVFDPHSRQPSYKVCAANVEALR